MVWLNSVLGRDEMGLTFELEIGMESFCMDQVRPGFHGVFARAVGPGNSEGKGAELGEVAFMTDYFVDKIDIFV